MNTIQIKNSNDLLYSIALDAADIKYKDQEFSGDLSLIIKLDGDQWADAKTLDYRIAKIVTAFQEDILSIVNNSLPNKKKISEENLLHHPELIVKFKIQDGCLELIVKALNSIFEFAKDMSEENKMRALKISLAIVLTMGGSWVAVTGIKTVGEAFIHKIDSETSIRLKEMDVTIEQIRHGINPSLKSAIKTLSKRTKTQKAIASVVKDEDIVTVNNSKPVKGKKLKTILEDQEIEIDQHTHRVDGTYKITAYNFEDNKAEIKGKGRRYPFWAQTKYLEDAERQRLISLASEAIRTKIPQSADLQVTIEVSDKKITGATIAGFAPPRENTISLKEAIQGKEKSTQQSMLTLPCND